MSSKSVKTPVSVLVEDVYIVVGPKTPREFNAEKYIEEMVKAKLSSLETWQTTVFPDDKEAQDAYGMVDKIVDNICVSVNRVHVRFESEDYAFGIALSSLGIHTTDSKWNDITPPPKPKCIYRKLTLSKLQLYLNTKDDLKDRHKMATMSILKDIYRDPADQKCAWVPLIPPISAELRVAMEKATEEKLSEADAPKPKTFAEIIFEPIGLTLSKTQYLNMLKMLEDISKTEALPDLPDYNEPAADADRDAYIAMYKRLFEDAKGGRAYKKVKKNETEAMETWEKKWAFADVVSFRYAAYEVAKLELAAEDPKLSNKTRDKRGGITGGLRSMFSSGPAVPELLNREDYLAVFDSKTEAEKKAEALLDRMKQLDPSYVATFAQVRFKQLFLALKDGKQPLVQYNIFNLDVQYKQRPVSMLAAVSIEKLEGIDLFSEDTRHKKFLRGSDAKEKLVSLAYETNPPVNPDKIDSRVRLQVGSLDVAIVMNVMNKFAAFFTPPTPVDLSKVREQAVARLADIQKNASTRLAEAVKNRQKMELDVVVKAPSIIVPQDPSSSTCDVLVLDLGTLILRSRVAGGDVSDRKIDTETLIANANKQSDLTDAYRRGLFDSFSLQLKNFTLFLAEGGDRWRQRTAESKDKKLTILAPFSIPLDLDNAISPAVLTLPSINVNGRITKIAVHVSSRRMRKIMKIVEALTAADDDAEIPPASEAKAIAPPPKQSDEKSQPKKSENKSAGDAQSAESGGGDSKDKSGGDAKEAPAGPAPTADYRNTKINLSLGIEAVSLLITNDVVRRRPRDVLRLTIGQTKIFFRQREFDMRGGFAVQSIGVEDLLQTNGDAFRFIVSTNKDSSAMRELIRDLEAKTVSTGSGGRPGLERAPTRVVDYGKDSNFFAINFAAVSPEATDIYDNVNSTLNLNVGTLVVATNAETVPRMAHFFQYELMPPAKPKDPVAEIKELEALEAAGQLKLTFNSLLSRFFIHFLSGDVLILSRFPHRCRRSRRRRRQRGRGARKNAQRTPQQSP